MMKRDGKPPTTLTAQDAREIYFKNVVEEVSRSDVAKMFNVSPTMVSRIRLGRLWNEATADLRRQHGQKRNDMRLRIQKSVEVDTEVNVDFNDILGGFRKAHRISTGTCFRRFLS